MKCLTLLPVVGYIRMSSDKQEASPAQQRGEISRLAAACGYEIKRWYIDEGISGGRSDRVDFQKMIGDAERDRDFRMILVWDQDRFSRFEPMEFFYYCFRLKQAGVGIHSCNQGALDLDTPNAWLLTGVTQSGKSEFLKTLSKNVKRARAANHAAGKFGGGVLPFGLTMDRLPPDARGRARLSGKPIIHAEAGAIVAEVFRRYDGGEGANRIAKDLNLRGVPTAGQINGTRQSCWTALAINRMLCREEYIGKVAIGAATVACEALVDVQTFGRVQKRLAARKKAGVRRRGSFALTGLVWCAECGSAMCGTTVSASRGHAYYRCGVSNSAPGAGKCSGQYVREAQLFAAIQARALAHAITNWEALTAAVSEGDLGKAKDATAAERRRLDRRLADIDAKLVKARATFMEADADLRADAAQYLRDLKAERETLADQAATVVPLDSGSAKTAREAAVASWARRMDDLASDDAAVVRNALAGMVERIDLSARTEQRGKRRRVIERLGVISFRNELALSDNRQAP